MGKWSTTYTAAHFIASTPRELLWMINCSLKAMKIPRKGTKWTGTMFGDRVVVFAKWNREDETDL